MCSWKRVIAITSVFSCQNCVSFCPASFCTPRSNLPVIPGLHCKRGLTVVNRLIISVEFGAGA